jgi:hypothetical protein
VAPSRGFIATLRWYKEYVLPFIERRLRGTSSGDGMTSKHLKLTPYANLEIEVVAISRSEFARAA